MCSGKSAGIGLTPFTIPAHPSFANASYPTQQENSDPQCAIETSILNRLAYVFGSDGFGGIKVGDGARDFENAIVGAGAEV